MTLLFVTATIQDITTLGVVTSLKNVQPAAALLLLLAPLNYQPVPRVLPFLFAATAVPGAHPVAAAQPRTHT
jgi:hypothetical protein